MDETSERILWNEITAEVLKELDLSISYFGYISFGGYIDKTILIDADGLTVDDLRKIIEAYEKCWREFEEHKDTFDFEKSKAVLEKAKKSLDGI